MSIERIIEILRDAGFEVELRIVNRPEAQPPHILYTMSIVCEGCILLNHLSSVQTPSELVERIQYIVRRICDHPKDYSLGVVSCGMKAMAKMNELEGDRRFCIC